MVDAIETRPGTDPDRASFTTALETARDQLTAAAGICPAGRAAQPGAIGRAVLATLLPARRPRYSARTVKCSTSRYHEHDHQPPPAPCHHHRDRASPCAPRPEHQLRPRRPHRKTTPASRSRPPAASGSPPSSPATRRETGAATNSPLLLDVKPRNMLTQLGEWALLGFFTRTGYGTYRLNTPPARRILDNRNRPLTTRHCVRRPAGPPSTRWPRAGQSKLRKMAACAVPGQSPVRAILICKSLRSVARRAGRAGLLRQSPGRWRRASGAARRRLVGGRG